MDSMQASLEAETRAKAEALRIKNILQRAKEVPRGLAICSPLFSLAGIREMLLEFYPNGIDAPSSPGKEDYCGFYVRCPPGNSLTLTLFVGKAKKGPIKTDFDGNAAKGLPEFCRFEEQLYDEDSLVVGIVVRNPKLLQDSDQPMTLE